MATDLQRVLLDISLQYGINFNELKEKYLKPDVAKKRGRKKKMKEEFIDAEEYDYQGVTYLVDNKNK